MDGEEPMARPNAKIIPLMVRPAVSSTARRAELRAAVIEVVRHLVVEAVPKGQRSADFDQARELLDEAGWGLDELFEAAADGPAQESLFRTLGLSE